MSDTSVDVLLVGGGVMSATLGVLLMQLDPDLRIAMVERLDHVADESTDAWNNAGTGHAGYCELNYTPQLADGSVAIERALSINAAFEVSLQLWAHLVEQGALPAAQRFINAAPHQSFVWGADNVDFLRRRHAALSRHHLFRDMQYSEDHDRLRQWMPLIMQGRDDAQAVAATRVDYGADVDFGILTHHLVDILKAHGNFELLLRHSVQDMQQQKNGRWNVRMKDATGAVHTLDAGFVFLGAGGGALPLLQKSGIAEGRGYGGFPVSGQWLVCNNPEVVARHDSKVYGKAPLGAPPMSVPHLDTRIIRGQPALLFGPYAGFTTKFLKNGSFLDMFRSIHAGNLKPMLAAGRHNLDLTRYLVSEVFQSHAARIQSLSRFYPEVKAEDWTLTTAGQRVQIIKPLGRHGGKLEFGTEIVAAGDGSLAALLGASPGASVSVPAMLEVIERCFSKRINSENWQEKLQAMIPSYRRSLVDDAALLDSVRSYTLRVLGLSPSAVRT